MRNGTDQRLCVTLSKYIVHNIKLVLLSHTAGISCGLPTIFSGLDLYEMPIITVVGTSVAYNCDNKLATLTCQDNGSWSTPSSCPGIAYIIPLFAITSKLILFVSLVISIYKHEI